MKIDGEGLVGGAYFEKLISWGVVFRPATSKFVQIAHFLNLWGEGVLCKMYNYKKMLDFCENI